MKRFFSILRDVAFIIFVLFICGMIFIMSTGKHFSIAGYQVLRVLTSSMEPAIAENTCIIIKEYPVDQLKVGDIITFTSDDPQIQGYYNTHRIHDIVEENGETLFVTKGDASSAVDAYPVHKDQVAGIFVKELPGGRTLGKCFLALSDNRVYFLVIMLPLAVCLLSYFWQIVSVVTGRYDEEEDEGYKVIVNEMDELDDMMGYPVMEQTSQMKEASNVGEISGAEGIYGKEEVSEVEGISNKTGTSGIEENSGIERKKETESNLQTEKMSDDINTIISDSEIEAILAEAASKIDDTKIEPEKARIDRIVEELTSNSVSDELVKEKREKLKADYKKINKNYSKSGSE